MVSRVITGYKNKEKVKDCLIYYEEKWMEVIEKEKGKEKINLRHWYLSEIVVAYV
jgi:hypothetical protein